MTTAALIWHTETRLVDALIPYEKNPRTFSDQQRRDCEASITKFNLVEIPAINTDNTVIAGHARLRIVLSPGSSVRSRLILWSFHFLKLCRSRPVKQCLDTVLPLAFGIALTFDSCRNCAQAQFLLEHEQKWHPYGCSFLYSCTLSVSENFSSSPTRVFEQIESVFSEASR